MPLPDRGDVIRKILFALLLLTASAAAAEPEFRLEGFPNGARESMLRDCRAAYAEARAWFGLELESPVTVRWATEARQLHRAGLRGAQDVAGLAISDANLVILYAPALAPHPQRVRPVLSHELCHLFVARATERAGSSPRWLNEGIAMFVSGEWDLGSVWRSNHDTLLRDALAAEG